MNINQISVFLENKPGNLSKFTKFLADNDINMSAFQIVDNSDYGIVRIIVDKPFDTLTMLKDNGWVCNMTQVVCVKIPDAAGEMYKALSVLDKEGISIDYAYTYPDRKGDGALMVIRVAEPDKVAGIFSKSGIRVIEG